MSLQLPVGATGHRCSRS